MVLMETTISVTRPNISVSAKFIFLCLHNTILSVSHFKISPVALSLFSEDVFSRSLNLFLQAGWNCPSHETLNIYLFCLVQSMFLIFAAMWWNSWPPATSWSEHVLCVCFACFPSPYHSFTFALLKMRSGSFGYNSSFKKKKKKK